MNSHTLAALQQWQEAEGDSKKSSDKPADKPAQGTKKES
jgi:hypothetical protein